MTFHILGLPHTVSSKKFLPCAYTQKVVKFAKMMSKRGHTIIHYGHEDSDLECTEHVTTVTREDWKKSYGDHDWQKKFFKFNTNDHAYKVFTQNTTREILKRANDYDFILPFFGAGQKEVCDAVEAKNANLIVVEPGIGYSGGSWAKWRVFESYALMHAYAGTKSVGTCIPKWYDVVIPNYFDEDEFTYRDKKDDYLLFLGRVYEGKGVHIAIQVAEKLGKKLIIAGQTDNEFNVQSDNITYIGSVDLKRRAEILAGAKALIAPSLYIEPFGGVMVEAFLSGTPVISTDWGSFAENNIHGLTGYRCRTFADFVHAVENVYNGKIKSIDCLNHGHKFTLNEIAPQYEKFFQDVLNVYQTKEGWYLA